MIMKKLLLSVVVASAALVGSAFAEEKTITDVLGREVTVDVPLKRPVVAFYYPDFLAVAGESGMDNVVGFSKDVWTVWNPKSWEAFSAAVPKLKEITDVGEVEAGTFSMEKVLALKPDALILSDWQYQAIKGDLAPLEAAKIPVIVLDYNKEKVDLHVKSTEIIGELTSNEDRAKKLVDEYKGIVDGIVEKVKASGKPKPKIYIEFGKGGPDDVGFTYGKNMWGALAELAQGDNIAAPYVENWGPMNPEQVIASKPDVIMIAGRETEATKNDYGMAIGITIPEAEVVKRLDGFKKRQGWAELPAVKNGRLYGIYQGASRTIADGAMIQFMAKQLYPELFADVNPLQTYLDFHKKYLPVVPKGSFMVEASK